MTTAPAGKADATNVTVAASAVSRQRTVLVEIGADGYVIGVRLLSDAVRLWDSETLEQRLKAVASVAHDRYLAGLGATDGRYPTLELVAAAELELDF